MKPKTEGQLTFRKRMGTIIVPKGFTTRFDDTNQFGRKELVFVLEKEGDCKFEFRYEHGEGTTTFSTIHGQRTFDRTGVESSFYHRPWPWEKKPQPVDLNALIAEQLEKIKKSREFAATSIAIPDIPFRISPKEKDELKKRLKKLGYLTFMPSGFGTGYRLTKKPYQKLRYGEKRAVPELEKFFGHSPLYVSTMDCD